VVEGVIIANHNTACAVVPSTIPPEHYFINQYITRGKYTKTTVVSENGPPPSELKLAWRISSAPLKFYRAVRIDAYPTVLSFAGGSGGG
ncbi:MAG: hypothetical protein J6D06_02095, partial [Clostridia bacterium]|nr:hypothetical protein [Clostridia bacterium]